MTVITNATVILFDRRERELLNEAIDKIEEHRRNRLTEGGVELPAGKIVEAPAPAAEAPTPAAEEPVTEEQLRSALQSYMKDHGLAAASAMLTKYGADRISAVPEALRPQLMKELS